jgi:hypothetical protein
MGPHPCLQWAVIGHIDAIPDEEDPTSMRKTFTLLDGAVKVDLMLQSGAPRGLQVRPIA